MFLPSTGAIFGRPSKPRSHHLYQVKGPAPTEQFRDPITKKMIVELRGDGGFQTVFPPSTHESGEKIEWESDGDLTVVDYQVLLDAVTKLAARCLIARYIPSATDSDSLWSGLDAVDPRIASQIRVWLKLCPEKSDKRDREPSARSERFSIHLLRLRNGAITKKPNYVQLSISLILMVSGSGTLTRAIKHGVKPLLPRLHL